MSETHIKVFEQISGPILILGGSGFVGANLAYSILKYNKNVYTTSTNSHPWRLKDFPEENIFTVNLLQENAIEELIFKVKPKIIVNCLAYGAYSFQVDSEKIYMTNFILTTKILSYINQNLKNECTYIHFGSSSEYGHNCNAPEENDQKKPDSHYSVSKIATSYLIEYYGKTLKTPCLNLRLYSAYGPLEEQARLIPQLILQAQKKSFPNFTSGEISRDFIYIDDVCRAVMLSILNIDKKIYGESLNIGTGKKTTISELAILSKSLFNIKKDPIFETYTSHSWDQEDWYANPNKANELIHFTAKVSLEEGLQKTSDWISTMDLNLYKRNSKKLAKA